MQNMTPLWKRRLAFIVIWLGCIVLFMRPQFSVGFFALSFLSFVFIFVTQIKKVPTTWLKIKALGRYIRHDLDVKALTSTYSLRTFAFLQRYRAVIIVLSVLLAFHWTLRSVSLLETIQNNLLRAALLYFVGTVFLIGIAAIIMWRQLRLPEPSDEPLSPQKSNWILAGLGGLMLGALAESNGNALGIEHLANISTTHQLSLLVGGIFFLVWGLGGGAWPRRLPKISLWELTAVLAITGLAFFLRFYALETAVRHLIDELNFGTYAIYFRFNQHIKLLWPEVRGFPIIFSYLQWVTMDQWGYTLLGFRLPSVILGTLTIPALYLLARALFDRPVALSAALLLAVFPPHVHHSRLALNNIADPLFGTLALAFLAWGIRTNRRVYFAAAGASLGLTQYFYEGGRLFYPPLILACMIFGLIVWRPTPSLKGFAITILAAVMVAMPIYYTLEALERPSVPRFESEGLKEDDLVEDSFEYYLGHLKFSFLAYTSQPEWVSFYYGGKYGLVLPYLLPAALLGLAFLFWRSYSLAALILIWFLAATVANSLLRLNVLSTRYVVMFPVLPLLIALGVRYTAALLWQKRLPVRYQHAVVGLIVLMMAAGQVNYYFGEHLSMYNQQIRQYWRYAGEDAVFRASKLPDYTSVYIVSEQAINGAYAIDILKVFQPNLIIRVIPSNQDKLHHELSISPYHQYAFFIEPDDHAMLQFLKTRFTKLDGPFKGDLDSIEASRQLVLYRAKATYSIPFLDS